MVHAQLNIRGKLTKATTTPRTSAWLRLRRAAPLGYVLFLPQKHFVLRAHRPDMHRGACEPPMRKYFFREYFPLLF
ncbi:jg27035, partial [Pararge aegeria aegeria]